MNGYWIKLHAQIIDSQVFANAELLRVWIWCLCKATWKKKHVSLKTGTGETTVTLNPGQFVYGREASARELISKPETLRGQMKKLVEMGNISVLATRHYSIVNVCNWQTYQKRQKRNSQPDTSQTPARHHKPEVPEVPEVPDKSTAGSERPQGEGELTRKIPEEPTLKEVEEYCAMRAAAGNRPISAAQFHARYASVGWIDKNGQPIRSWRALVRYWEVNADKYDNKFNKAF